MAGTPTAPPKRALVRGLAGACHPLPSLAVTTVAVLLAVGVGHDTVGVVLIGAAVLTGQLSIGWSNDWIDAARDRATGRAAKPAAAGQVPVPVVAVAAGVALATTVVLSALLGTLAAVALLIGVAAGWAYNLGLKATVWSGAAYLVAFGALPLGPYLALPEHPWPRWWVPVVGALLGFAAHFANVLPDLRADAATGVRGLPQRLGPRWGVVVMAVVLAAASVVLGLNQTSWALGVVAVGGGVLGAAAATAVALRSPDSPAAFRITIAIALLAVVLLIAGAV
ncbi:UbiA family prenyltransferase [Umezawaea sp. NPDC059074]|uniref:UbiA family prenyltransferase n=1 Tax=Umezawaea sp. NPDC059074 TaxID=3346716 RepID=UPI0036C4644B